MTYHRNGYGLVEVLIKSKTSGHFAPPGKVKNDTANEDTNDGKSESVNAFGLQPVEQKRSKVKSHGSNKDFCTYLWSIRLQQEP